MQWTKPDSDPAAVSRDIDACRAQALGRSSPMPAIAGNRDARADTSFPGRVGSGADTNERFVEEHEAVSACMIRRGYELRRVS
jgi:hypothetical protein